jgi:hypothetical protein
MSATQIQTTHNTQEENLLLQEEIQCLREYGHQDLISSKDNLQLSDNSDTLKGWHKLPKFNSMVLEQIVNMAGDVPWAMITMMTTCTTCPM